MKLEIELVPKTSWYNNLRKILPGSEWDRIRKEAYRNANYRCEICGQEGRLSCHEIWSYDDIESIQKLEGFQALCDDCHMIKHIGFAGIQASKGLLDMDKLISHFMKVNNVNADDFKIHKAKAISTWAERSRREWTVDLGKWNKFL